VIVQAPNSSRSMIAEYPNFRGLSQAFDGTISRLRRMLAENETAHARSHVAQRPSRICGVCSLVVGVPITL
jgi:hypothetical protein